VTTVVFALVPGVLLLDFAGPAQVFSTAAGFGYDYGLRYVAAQPVVPTAQHLPVQAETELPELDVDDLIIVPGWSGDRLADPVPIPDFVLQGMVAHHAAGGTVASVCAGAEALGRAGLLDGRRCTTHHAHQDELARRYPHAQVVRDVLFTEDDRVVTSAGIASGIDLALHLVASRHGPALAARIAREMVIYTRRNGAAAQESAMLRHRVHLSDQVHRAQELIESRFDASLRLAELAAAVGVSERTLTRRFIGTIGLTPLRYQQTLRLERAEALIAQGSTVAAAARSVGFEDARMLRRLRAASRRPDRDTRSLRLQRSAREP
jgi:transcriptional regulator GlxA family with amidase domain